MLNTTAPLPLHDPSLFRQACLVNGRWIEAASGATLTVINPATGAPVGTVPALGAAETRTAIEAARAAFPAWRKLLAKERATILRRLFDLMLANADDLAMIMTAEQGKPLAESKGEIVYAASFIEWFAEEGKRVYGDVIPAPMPGRRIIVTKEPIGVFAAITPWNFPAAMITRKAGPGWAAGCTGRAGRTRRHAPRCMQHRDRSGRRRGRRADREPHRPQAQLHRQHRSGRQAARAMRADHQEDQHGAGRQRAVHRVRRC